MSSALQQGVVDVFILITDRNQVMKNPFCIQPLLGFEPGTSRSKGHSFNHCDIWSVYKVLIDLGLRKSFVIRRMKPSRELDLAILLNQYGLGNFIDGPRQHSNL